MVACAAVPGAVRRPRAAPGRPRGWARTAREADLVGALFLAIALGGVILAFATADPEVQVFSDRGLWYLLGSALATVAFVVHLRRAEAPLSPAARCGVPRPGARCWSASSSAPR